MIYFIVPSNSPQISASLSPKLGLQLHPQLLELRTRIGDGPDFDDLGVDDFEQVHPPPANLFVGRGDQPP